MRPLRALGLALLAAGLVTCGDSQEPATAGWLDVRLTSPNTNDGGIIFTVSGAAIDSVRSSFGEFYSEQGGSTSWRMLVAGNVTSGVVAQIWVPNQSRVEAYIAAATQAAARDTFEQLDVAGYELTVER